MAAGQTAAGFGSGFAGGLTRVLLGSRERQQDEESRQAREQFQLEASMLPEVIRRAPNFAAVVPFIERLAPGFGKGAQGKAKMQIFEQMLSPLLGQQDSAAGQDGAAAAGVPGAETTPPEGTMLPPDTLAPSGPVGPGAAPTPRTPGAPSTPRTPGTVGEDFGGLLTPDQMAARATQQEIATADAQTKALVQRARDVVLPALKSVNPQASIEDALRVVGIDFPRELVNRFQSVAGEVVGPDGTPTATFAIFDPTSGAYVDATTQAPLPGFRPRTSTGSTSLGTDREAIARELFGKRASELAPEQLSVVNRLVQTRAQETALARGRGTGQARIETELGMPLSLTESATQDVPIGTSLRQLSGYNAVTPDQKERKDAALALAPQLSNIESLVTAVFPPQSGLTGTLTASAVLRQKRAANDPDFAKLDAAINLAIGNVARVLAAESGRLTEQDAERARSALADLQGFTDTRESALAKLTEAKRAMEIIATAIQTPGDQLRGQQGAQGQGANRRVRARQALLGAGKVATEETIDVFLQNNPGF